VGGQSRLFQSLIKTAGLALADHIGIGEAPGGPVPSVVGQRLDPELIASTPATLDNGTEESVGRLLPLGGGEERHGSVMRREEAPTKWRGQVTLV
jgi:hypothetical protein